MSSEFVIAVSERMLYVVVGAIVSALVTYASIKHRVRSELRSEFNVQLRGERMSAYKSLWQLLGALALYAPEEDITGESLVRLNSDLSKWYFEHGMFLSKDSRDFYFNLQEALVLIIRNTSPQERPSACILRDRNAHLTLEETKKRETHLGLRGDATAIDMRTHLAALITDDMENNYFVARYLSSRLRTELTRDLSAREELWV